ncbi:pentatricopeptide repeat-containing protein At3g07290, mitochondrial-like [Aristolochia californica]|uniref:pentatricopeptide repeat-containing protein At3g07290, mitochondrial-like n=1 Tax=Aristolochia californica TaxID=171875 RepID=UPI0035D9973C
MVKAGSQPNSVTYSCLIHGLCNVGTIDEALDLIKEMVAKGLGPTASTYTLPLTSLCEAGRLTEACDLFIDMRKRCVCPNVQTHTGLVPGLFRVDYFEIAIGLFHKMLQDSVVALINGYFKLGNLNNAMRLLNFMQENGCEPDERTFTKLNLWFLQNVLPEAERLCREIAEQRLFPTVVTYTTLIDGLCKSGATSLAFTVVDEMMKHDCLPNLHTYNTLIYGLCQEVNAMEAELLFKEMQRKGLIPDLVTYTSVIDEPYGVLLKGLQKDQDFLEEDHIDIYLSTGKARGSTIVAGLLDRLLENGCGPYFDTYVTLLVGLWRKESRYLSHTCTLIKSLIAPSYLDGRTCWSDKVYYRTIGNWYCLAKQAVASAALKYGQKHKIQCIVAVRDVAEALLLIYARLDESRRSICGPHAIRSHDLVDKTEHVFTV